MALRLVDSGGLAARLAGRDLPAQGFTAPARRAALARLEQMGLPGPRDEYWRYTGPAPLNDALVPLPPMAGMGALFAAREPLRVVFRNGRFDAAASDDLALEGVQISPLSQAMAADLHWAQDIYGALEQAGQSPVPRPFAALNTAFAEDGLLLHVTARAQRPISLIYHYDSAHCDAILHHCIRLEPGAELTLLEQGQAGARANILCEIDLAPGASLHHIRAQTGHGAALAHGQVFARLSDNAQLKSFTLTAGGRLVRHETLLDLHGQGAAAHVAGAYLGGAGDTHDDTVFITHQGRACESRQVFKNVLRAGATGVFQGKILVKSSAQKTDGYQISQSLLLDESAQFLAKPELEIYADDVKCSHGSTSGALDEAALFYLQSRGVPRAQAQALLVQAFLGAAMDEIADPALADDMRALAASLLQGDIG
jgi:Fe-S cluster assembly protein SufD